MERGREDVKEMVSCYNHDKHTDVRCEGSLVMAAGTATLRVESQALVNAEIRFAAGVAAEIKF